MVFKKKQMDEMDGNRAMWKAYLCKVFISELWKTKEATSISGISSKRN